MALTTHVQARVPTKTLRELTNPNDRQPSTVDTAYLDLAVSAAESDFDLIAHVEYDDTSQMHIEAGVMGVLAYLSSWTSKGDTKKVDKFHTRLEKIGDVSSHKRISPVTDSEYAPTRESELVDGTPKPKFDPSYRPDMSPRPPAAGTER